MWPLILTNWKIALCATALICLSAALSVQTWRLHSAQAALTNEKDAHAQTKALHQIAVESAKAKETEQRTKYEQAQEKANERHQAVVEQAKANAVKNFVAHFGDPRNLGSGLRFQPMPSTDSAGTGTPASNEGDDAAGRERLASEGFVEACARDAGRLDTWRQWCVDAGCEVIE